MARNSGFSLVEALVAVALGASLVGALLSLFTSTGRLTGAVGAREKALLFAEGLVLSSTLEDTSGDLGDGLAWRREVVSVSDEFDSYVLAEVRVVVDGARLSRPVRLSVTRIIPR